MRNKESELVSSNNSNDFKRKKGDLNVCSLCRSTLNIIQNETVNDYTKQLKNETEECIICMAEYNKNELVNIHQNHFKMCGTCLCEQGNALLRNIDLLPWKCPHCQEILSINILKDYMNNYDKLLNRVTGLLTKNSISCPNCDNSYLLDKDQKKRSYIFCSLCHYKIIVNDNKNNASLKETENTKKALELANTNGWKECPSCGEMIEKSGGCNQMTHREANGSHTYFCYQCGDQLTSYNIDSQGNNHYPNGSYNDCINIINNFQIEEVYLGEEEVYSDDEGLNIPYFRNKMRNNRRQTNSRSSNTNNRHYMNRYYNRRPYNTRSYSNRSNGGLFGTQSNGGLFGTQSNGGLFGNGQPNNMQQNAFGGGLFGGGQPNNMQHNAFVESYGLFG